MPFQLGEYVGRYCSGKQQPPLPSDVGAELSPAELAAAAPLTNASDLRCLAQKLAGGAPLRLVMFGTSVTAGNRCNARHGSNFPTLTAQLLNRRFPKANVTLSVFSYPGASPVFMRSCLDTLLPAAHADAVVVEMTDNLAKSAAGGMPSRARTRASHRSALWRRSCGGAAPTSAADATSNAA